MSKICSARNSKTPMPATRCTRYAHWPSRPRYTTLSATTEAIREMADTIRLLNGQSAPLTKSLRDKKDFAAVLARALWANDPHAHEVFFQLAQVILKGLAHEQL